MGWKALVPPRPWVVENTGLCLRYAQSFFGAPVNHRSAWHAWLATEFKQGPEVPIPDVPVLLWYSHVGPYNDGNGWYDGVAPGQPANWGHVTPIIPGQGIYSSPASGRNNPTFDVYETIRDVERTFNATYVGWSLDINGLLVAAWEEDDDMYSDDDRKRDNQVAKDVTAIRATVAEIKQLVARVPAIDDAIFTRKPTSFGTPGGLLVMSKRTDDALFKPTETSFGTPGGALVNGRETLAALDQVNGKLDQIIDGKAGGE